MKPGDVVRIRGLRAQHGGRSYTEYRAEPGEVLVMVYLGTESQDGEELNVLEVLHSLGWRRVQASALPGREGETT